MNTLTQARAVAPHSVAGEHEAETTCSTETARAGVSKPDGRRVAVKALPPWVFRALREAESGGELSTRSRSMLVKRGLALPPGSPTQRRTWLTALGREALARETAPERNRQANKTGEQDERGGAEGMGEEESEGRGMTTEAEDPTTKAERIPVDQLRTQAGTVRGFAKLAMHLSMGMRAVVDIIRQRATAHEALGETVEADALMRAIGAAEKDRAGIDADCARYTAEADAIDRRINSENPL